MTKVFLMWLLLCWGCWRLYTKIPPFHIYCSNWILLYTGNGEGYKTASLSVPFCLMDHSDDENGCNGWIGFLIV